MAGRKPPKKSYENLDFIHSSDGRMIRILAEYLEPGTRFRKYHILDTIVFFGSARLKSRRQAQREYNKMKNIDPKTPNIAEKLRKCQHDLKMSKYYEDAVELSKLITKWSKELDIFENRFIVCTGAGPGIMEAANKGAKKAGGYSIGLSISLPFEQAINKYVTPQLGFEFHYFFMRKFWFAYLTKALIVFPGGFGTMDELFEILTLVQTGKIKKELKIIIYDEKYWKSIVNFDGLVNNGVISKTDMNLFTFCNSPEEALKEITEHLEKYYLKGEGQRD